jgi:hypothetical protein
MAETDLTKDVVVIDALEENHDQEMTDALEVEDALKVDVLKEEQQKAFLNQDALVVTNKPKILHQRDQDVLEENKFVVNF